MFSVPYEKYQAAKNFLQYKYTKIIFYHFGLYKNIKNRNEIEISAVQKIFEIFKCWFKHSLEDFPHSCMSTYKALVGVSSYVAFRVSLEALLPMTWPVKQPATGCIIEKMKF